MTTSPEASQDMCLERARSLAGRMLRGGAACSLVAWRISSQYDFVAHGLTTQGDIVVAVRPDEDCLLSTLPPGCGTVVRMDLTRHSNDVTLSVIAASAHLLGELVLLPNAAVDRLMSENQLPGRVADLAQISGTRIASWCMTTVGSPRCRGRKSMRPAGKRPKSGVTISRRTMSWPRRDAMPSGGCAVL